MSWWISAAVLNNTHYEYEWSNLIQTKRRKEHWKYIEITSSQTTSFFVKPRDRSLALPWGLILSIRKTGNTLFSILHKSPAKSCFPFCFSWSSSKVQWVCRLYSSAPPLFSFSLCDEWWQKEKRSNIVSFYSSLFLFILCSWLFFPLIERKDENTLIWREQKAVCSLSARSQLH